MSTANDKQVGGTHYKATKPGIPEHWDIVIAMGWDYLVGNASKYLWRLGKKNGSFQGQLEDINKAIHYLEKKRELLEMEIKPRMATSTIPITTMEVMQKTSIPGVTESDPINGPE